MARMKKEFVETMIRHLNRKDWWHCPPSDPRAYDKRGKFLASSFSEAELWGRPLDQPEHVTVSNPLIGDELSIQMELFGHPIPERNPEGADVLEWRWNLDAKMKRAALAKGYDSIVLLASKAFVAYREHGKIPRSIELNVLRP
jgi:hypothetical protein